MWFELAFGSALSALLLTAVFTDVRYHRIPNWLTLPAWVMGVALGAVVDGWAGAGSALGGFGIAFGVALVFYLLGWAGAGDVKLVAAVGALVGVDAVSGVLIGIGLAGLVMALVVLAGEGQFRAAVQRISAMIGLTVVSRHPTYIPPPKEQTGLILPYAVPIAIGTFVALALAF